MINPWTEWQQMLSAGKMLSETMTASQAVVEHRSRTIEQAMSNPPGADMTELGLMVSEKSAAFGLAGASLSKDWLAMQRDLTAQFSDLSAMMFGQLPGPRRAQKMLARGSRLGSTAVASSVRAMTPIHRAATANQRRLERKA